MPPVGRRVRVAMGDDAAITVPEGATATSVDAIVDGVHFRRERSTLVQIGHKALATALSDLAAMGADPGEAYTVLGVPPDLDEDGCIELFDGIAALAAQSGTTLAGGDVTRAPALMVAMTVVGHAPSVDALVTRSGARAGDLVVLSGELGGAAAGLLLLDRPALAEAVDDAVVAKLRNRQLEPTPQLEVGRALARIGATAMIDLSDGLGGDAGHLAQASGVALWVDADRLPLDAGVEAVAEAAGLDAMQLAGGGEDYELLATLPPGRLDEATVAAEATGARLTAVGEVVEGGGVEIRLPGGRLWEPGGFDQLR